MRNKITILMSMVFVFFASQTFAQYDVLDFETGATGTTFSWTVTENGSNPPLAFPANPASGGINTSATVAHFVAEQAGQPWALAFTDDIDPFTFNGSNTTVKIMVYKTVISPVAIKFEGASPNVEIQISNTTTNAWEEITFDFSGSIGNTYSRLVVIPDFDMAGRTQDNTIYFDNIQIPDATGTTGAVDSVDVTFSINAASVATSGDGLFLAGGALFGVPGDNPMMDNGNDVWTITKRVAKGLTFDYTFTNGNCSDWSCKENIAGLPCAFGQWNDRQLAGAWSDTTILGCFGNCLSDGTCSGTINQINVTFQVDMTGLTVDPAGVFVGGNFEGWGGSVALTDADNDNIWEGTTAINENTAIEWKFSNGPFATAANQEVLDSIADANCTLTTGEFTNRYYQLGSADVTLDAFEFGSCDVASNTKSVFTKDGLFEINPTLVSNEAIINFTEETVFADKQIRVINSFGQVVMNDAIGQAAQYRLDATNLTNGLYFVVIEADGFAQTARILVNK